MKKNNFVFGLTFVFIFTNSLLFAQTAEQIEKAQQEIEKEKILRERIEQQKKAPEVEEKLPAKEVAPAVVETKILVTKITVTGVTLLSEKEINDIVLPYQNKESTVREMQKIADLVTDAYRKKNYITSRAYLPPQRIKEGVMEIRAVEGITGDIQVKGNRYFKSPLLRNKIALKRGEPFNYETLRRGLSKINEQPDRNVKAVLMPGKEAGTTDVVLEVKDQLPIHIGFDWDNFGSRYINKDRYSVRFTHNNLLGLDDKLFFQYQLSESGRYFLKNIRYLLPVTSNCEIGASASLSRIKLGRELKDSDARGKSKIYSLFVNNSLINRENLELTLNLGFDYKDIINYQSQAVTSHDRIRIVKTGLDLDMTDNFGRTILSDVIEVGIPNIMGGLDKQDSRSSHSGAGGKFVKNSLNFLRLNNFVFGSKLLFKTQFQYSPYILTASEQFQIGGVANVRAYPPAEAVGDRGCTLTAEWSIPPYLIPKNIKVPFSKAKFYDAFRTVIFYDWATARQRRPGAGEEKNKTLRGVGCGLRFNLPENFSVRLDFAWPLDNTPTDGDHMHTWAQVSKSF